MAHTYFVMRTPGEPDRLIVWDTRTLSVGRSPENALVVSEAEVSRRHAIFMKEGDRCEVGDHQTGNGTFLNGRPVSGTAPMQEGDRVAVGKVEFLFHETDEHPARLGMKLEYASHLMTSGMMPAGGNPNATMVGIGESSGDDEDFIIEHDDGSERDLFATDALELDELAPQAPVRNLDVEFGEKPVARAEEAPAAAAAPPAGRPEPSDPVERMRQLKSLHAEGLISDEEFTAKRAEILKGV